jgi:tetratricopeptide (TPR) repeat protein
MDALKLLEKSGRVDRLDPEGLYMAAQLNVARYEESIVKQQARLEDARRLLLEAQGRDLQNFRYPRLLSRIYLIYAEQAKDADKSAWLEKAYQAEFSAQNLYPGADITAFSLGELAEKLGRGDEAAKHYFRAVQIERQYRLQFEKMYPGRDVLSRLGEKRYEYAVEYLKRRGGED